MRVFLTPFAAMSLALNVGYARAQPVQPTQPTPNTIDCNGFIKLPNGDWYAKPDNPPFDLGAATQMTIRSSTIGPHAFNLGGYDLAEVLNAKCGAH